MKCLIPLTSMDKGTSVKFTIFDARGKYSQVLNTMDELEAVYFIADKDKAKAYPSNDKLTWSVDLVKDWTRIELIVRGCPVYYNF